MKIYTKSGDDGTTGLFGGDRVAKDSPRIEAYGEVDELNTIIGIALSEADPPERIASILTRIQGELFVLGADLATPERKERKNISIPRVTNREVACLEEEIDEIVENLPELRHFILPGGSALGARLHFARTVCRRAERRLVHLYNVEPSIGLHPLHYVNRLSDHLFVLARLANSMAGVEETPWIPASGDHGSST